jgi:excisionase family DNA binding protein
MNGHSQPSLADAIEVLEQVVMSVPLAEIPTLLGAMEKVKALGWGRMLAGPHNAQEDIGLLTIKEVAQRLKVSEYKAYEMVRQGVLKKTAIGTTSVRVKPSDLSAYLAQRGA